MCIPVLVDGPTFHEIRLPVDANSQITTFLFGHPELALPAGSFYDLGFWFVFFLLGTALIGPLQKKGRKITFSYVMGLQLLR